MIERIETIGREGDSCGGVIECVVRQPAMGLGMPVFDKLEADLAKAVMSLPATKGFEIGWASVAPCSKAGTQRRLRAGRRWPTAHRHQQFRGIQGGISNGEPIQIRVGFKPTATIRKEQQTIDSDGNATTRRQGRHDPGAATCR